jgi:hypothetical protein
MNISEEKFVEKDLRVRLLIVQKCSRELQHKILYC